jgi:hypothetical protein
LHTLAEKKHRLNANVSQPENSSTISNRLLNAGWVKPLTMAKKRVIAEKTNELRTD